MILPTDEEYVLIKQHALLPYVLAVFKRDKVIIEQSGLKTKSPYLELMDRSIDTVIKDIIQVRKELRSSGVKLLKEDKDEGKVTIRYLYKNYEHRADYLLELQKDFIEEKMREYLGGSVIN